MDFLHDQKLDVFCARPDNLETQITTAIIIRYRAANGMENTNGPRFAVGMDEDLSTRPLLTLYGMLPEDWKELAQFFYGVADSPNTLSIRWRDWQLECFGEPPVEIIEQAIDDWLHYQNHFRQVKERFLDFVQRNANQCAVVYPGKIPQSCVQKTMQEYSPETKWLVCRHSVGAWRVYNLARQEWGAPVSGCCGQNLVEELRRAFGIELSDARVCKGRIFMEFGNGEDAKTAVRMFQMQHGDPDGEKCENPAD